MHRIMNDLENQAMEVLRDTKPNYYSVFNLKLASAMLHSLLGNAFR